MYWCTADCGWVTGHSYVVYGPLLNGATVLMYEGAPNFPANDRFWKIIDEHKVTVFYTAPTAIRAFIKWGEEWVRRHSLASLRLLGTVGEPINPEAWMWYHREIGRERCPIVDTFWQTETGAIMIAPVPGAMAAKPGSATRPFFGIVPEVVTKEGEPVAAGQGGLLVVRRPWPAMARTIWGDAHRFHETYFSMVPGSYFTGDGARRDADGYFWLMGRVDDVINVSGHRLGTMEIESALVSHPKVAEAAVVGRPDEMKGQAIAAFVTLDEGHAPSEELREELRQWVVKEIGALARPETCGSRRRCPRRGAARSCGVCCERWRQPARCTAIRRRWRTLRCWPGCGRRKSKAGNRGQGTGKNRQRRGPGAEEDAEKVDGFALNLPSAAKAVLQTRHITARVNRLRKKSWYGRKPYLMG